MNHSAHNIRFSASKLNIWIFIAVFLSVSVFSSIVYLHYRQRDEIQRISLLLRNLRQERIDLAKGYLFFKLSDSPGSPFRFEEGLAYIKQSEFAFEQNFNLILKNNYKSYFSASGLTIINEYKKNLNLFRQLAIQKQINREAKISLRVIYYNLEKQAQLIDSLLESNINTISQRYNFIFLLILVGSACFMSFICFIIIYIVHIKRKTDKALNYSEKMYQNLFTNMLNGMIYQQIIMEKDEPVDLKFISVNKSFERLTGLKNVEGRRMSEIIPGVWATDKEFLNICSKVALTGVSETCEMYIHALQSWLYFSVYSFKRGYVNLIFDVITDRKEAEINLKQKNEEIEAQNEEYRQINEELLFAKEKAEESDKLKTAFLCNMSHEIRTPMNAIVGFSDFLTDPDTPIDKKETFATIIKERSFDLLGIIEDILDVSKIEVGQLKIVAAPTTVSEIVNPLFLFYKERQQTLKDKTQVKLIQNIPEIVLHRQLLTDEQRVKQILSNLLDNAIKFTSTGKIELGCKEDKEKNLIFYVRDSGIGIPEDKQQIIFNRFRQAEEFQTSRKFGGSGLGLSICKGLADLLNGKIWLESKVGEGSIFYFLLPFDQAILPEYNETNTNFDIQKSGYTGKALIVEDDLFNCYYLEELFKQMGIQTITANNGSEAMKKFRESKNLDLILMDIRLPDINGLELTKIIKRENPSITVIAQTAYAASLDRTECLKAGCDDFISKPLSKNRLIEIVSKYLKPKASEV
jgi:signal transduction histidine kinase/CheY-like chemotaxis protein